MGIEGKVISNRYEVLEKIGIGGMATVYKAKDNILKRYVAVKVLRDEFTTDEEFIKRFNSEAQSAASLTHPNIVSIYDVGSEDNIYYIVMELIQGKTLKEMILQDGVLPWKWSVNIAIQVASALETAHKNHIIHRDIKPHNIIITEDGIAKVTDFGIAKAVSNSTITAFGTTIGSVHYFSPEHARGGFTDAKSDIYSLGVVMYEMLTGRVPFDADTPVSVALKHMQEKAVEPIKLNPSIPFAINKIIMKAMEKETSLRYQSATEMLRDLSMALKSPEGDFVKNNTEQNQYTQRIPTVNEQEYTEPKKEEKKKKGKLATYFAKHPIAKKVVITLIAILLVILIPVVGFFGTKALLDAGKPKDVLLPNLVGKTLEEANLEVSKTKIMVEVTQEVFNNDIEAGKIISQDPPFIENYNVKENSTIKVVVSKGHEIAKVVKVVGMKYEDAEKALKDLNLVVEKVEETSKTVENGYVIKQEPEEGTELKAGEKVKVYVSIGTGIKQVSVPYVIGKSEADAKKELTAANLEVTIVYEEDTTKTTGNVLKQSLEAGKTVEEGAKITITVNKIEAIKTGTIKVNLKSVLGENSKIEIDENGKEINPTVEFKITINDETVYLESKQRKDSTSIEATASGKGTVTVKIWIDGVKKVEKQLDLSSGNAALVID